LIQVVGVIRAAFAIPAANSTELSAVLSLNIALMIAIRQYKHGTGCMAHHHLRRASELNVLQAGVAVSSYDDEIDLMLGGKVDDLLKWLAEFHAAADGHRVFTG
jgi:hypothetical protein